MDGGPQVPLAGAARDDRVLDPLLLVTGQHELAPRDVELSRVRCLGSLDPPVLGAGGCAAQVESPAAVWEADELGALQGLGVGLLLADRGDRLEALAVRGERDRDRVAAARPTGRRSR